MYVCFYLEWPRPCPLSLTGFTDAALLFADLLCDVLVIACMNSAAWHVQMLNLHVNLLRDS